MGGGVEISPLIKWDEKLLKCSGKKLIDIDRQNLMAFPLGGVVCGVYRRELIVDNKLFFPEHMKYEDNYWATFMKAELESIYLVESIGYLYRQRSSSTVHNNNIQSLNDRLDIEELHLTKGKERGIYEKYKEAFEYIYTVRRTFTTIKMYLKCETSIQRDYVRGLVKSLKKQFPKWEKNVYYREITLQRAKIKNKVIFCFPDVVFFVISIYKKIRNNKV